MVQNCAVSICKSYWGQSDIRFFKIPKTITSIEHSKCSVPNKNINQINQQKLKRREKWIRILKLGSKTDSFISNVRVCSLHFQSGNLFK